MHDEDDDRYLPVVAEPEDLVTDVARELRDCRTEDGSEDEKRAHKALVHAGIAGNWRL